MKRIYSGGSPETELFWLRLFNGLPGAGGCDGCGGSRSGRVRICVDAYSVCVCVCLCLCECVCAYISRMYVYACARTYMRVCDYPEGRPGMSDVSPPVRNLRAVI